jgi:hypothetical protein
MANGLIYKPVVPDFSEIGNNIQEIGQRVIQYRQNKKRHEQQRKDMMMKSYLSQANIKPYSFAASENQRIATELYGESIEKLKQIEDKDSWQGIIEANRITNEYEQKIGEVQQWSKQYAEDRQMVLSDPYSFMEHTREGIKNYQGGKPQYSIEVKAGDFGKMVNEQGQEFLGGNEVTYSWINQYDNKQVTSEQSFLDAYYKPSQDGEGWVRDEREQKKVFRNMLATNNKLRMAGLQELRENGKAMPNDRYMMANGKTYGVGNLHEYAYDMYRDSIFKMRTEKKVEPLDEDEMKIKDGKVNVGGAKKILVTDDVKQTLRTPALNNGKSVKYWAINDENIDIEQTLQDAVVVGKGGEIIKTGEFSDFNRAQLTGIVEAEDGEYAQLKAYRGEQKKTNKKGESLYRDTRTGLQGTKKEILRQYISNDYVDNMKEAKRMWRETRDDIKFQYSEKQGIDVYVPVDKNPGVKNQYVFENSLKTEQGKQTRSTNLPIFE